MGLFDKKYCDICGEKIGLFGTRKVADGIICSDCASNLSPWFDDRRETDLESIRNQLELREANREDVAQFHITREFGEDMKVLLDDDNGWFMVTDATDFEFETPDVFLLDEVTECSLNVEEEEEELLDVDEEGNDVSYDPPRYEYTYNFQLQILLDHAYIDEINITLNEDPLEIEYTDRSFFGVGKFDPERDAEYRHYADMADEIMTALTGEEEYEEECDEDCEEEDGEYTVCAYCNSRVKWTDNGRCPHCGGNLND